MAAQIYGSRKTRTSGRSFWQGFKTLKFNKLLNNLLAVITIGVMAVAGSLAVVYYVKSAENYSVPVSIQYGNSPYSWIKWRDVLFAGLPGLAYSTEKAAPVKLVSELSADKAIDWFILLLANINIRDKHSLLSQEIPLFTLLEKNLATSAIPQNTDPVEAAKSNLPSPPQLPPESGKAVKLSDKPLVGIYHTHTAESFIPTSGVSHKPGGQLGDITIVGEVFAKELEKRGVLSVQSKAIHDYPSFMKAYAVSEVTAEKMLADNPSIKMIFDIHRDAGKRENAVVKINGLDAARISIVVAKGQEDLPQPLWPQNQALAKLIDAKLTSYYPGLSKGIQLSEWRYNQHLHPGALLIEVGCQENSLEEASYSMQLIAGVIAEILKENKYQ